MDKNKIVNHFINDQCYFSKKTSANIDEKDFIIRANKFIYKHYYSNFINGSDLIFHLKMASKSNTLKHIFLINQFFRITFDNVKAVSFASSLPKNWEKENVLDSILEAKKRYETTPQRSFLLTEKSINIINFLESELLRGTVLK